MKFHLIAFDSIVEAVFFNARNRFHQSTNVDMSSSELINDVNGPYQKKLSEFIRKDELCVHTLRFGLDLYNRLKQTTTEDFFWKDVQDKKSSTDFVMCSLMDNSNNNYLPHLKNLYQRIRDATNDDDDAPIIYIKIMHTIPDDNKYLTDDGRIKPLRERKQSSTHPDTNNSNEINTTSTTSSVAHTSESTQRDVNVSSTSDNTTTSIVPNREVNRNNLTQNITVTHTSESQSTQRDVNVSSTSDNTTTSIVPNREVNRNYLTENITVTHTSVEDLPDKHFTVSGFGVDNMNVSLIYRGNGRNGKTAEERKAVKQERKVKKQKRANITSTFVRLGELEFVQASGYCTVLCSTTNISYMARVIIENKDNNDIDAPRDTKYKFNLKFLLKQADLIVPFTLLQQIVQRNGSNERPFISLPLFQHSHSLTQFATFHNHQTSTNGNHNHDHTRIRRSFNQRNNTSHESQGKRRKYNNRYKK